MEQVIQVTGLCVVGALLALVVKRGSPETALLLAVVLLCQAILFPFFFRVGTEQGRLYMILLSVLLLLGGVGLTSLLNVAVPAVSTLLMLAPVGLGVALAACLASVPVAVGQYAKRTW